MKLLMLGGTAEARSLAETLSTRPEINLTVSLAGATRAPLIGHAPTRVGGFGGEAGFVSYLGAERPDAVLDATHPFAEQITRRTARVCAVRHIPYRLLLRPAWVPQTGDTWREVSDEAAASALVTPNDRVFLATGRQTLERFSSMRAAYTWCRQIDPPEAPYPFENGEFLVGRPPFSIADEMALFERLGITVLIVKQAGGQASRSKLDAARELGIPVLMIRRPDYTGIPHVSSRIDALNWIEKLTHADYSL
ncbi:MAG: cobalt-precorrin-6A reductase [Dinoroseobacter sp.]|nr:cobalt-precorrin-6A reductase [Dinoroseobacter sp.]